MSKDSKILIVEDEQHINRLIELVLLTDGYYKIRKAYDGEEALKLIKEDKPDLILMDVQMPHMDGYKATETIRELSDEGKAHIPIVALTANAFEEDRKHALQLGMNEHLAKPVDIEKLKDVLTKYFNHEKREK